LNRRQILAAGAASIVPAASISLISTAAEAATRVAPVIFIHGAWHWGGCFQKVSDKLAAKGIPVATPDLASHGYSELKFDQVHSMDDYVAPVADMLARASVPVVLIGHSLGGIPLGYLASKYPNKIKKLIYLTAFMPNAKESATSIIGTYANDPAAAELFKVITTVESGVKIDLDKPDLLKAAFYGDVSAHDFNIASKNVTAITSNVPYGWVNDTPLANGKIPRVFIRCQNDKAIPIGVQDAMIKQAPHTKVLTIESSHSAFFSRPEQLADLIAAEV